MQHDLIKNQIETFVQKLDLLVRQSVLDHLKVVLSGSATGGGEVPAPKKRGRPAGSGGKRGRKPADLGDALGKMVDYVKANDGQGISAIAAGTGIDLNVAKKAALQLLASKSLKKSGERRGTVYHVGSGSVPAAGEAPAKAGKKRGRKKA